MAPQELFQNVMGTSTECISRITPDELANATPCSEWDLRALLNHMVYELLWVSDLLEGKTISEVGSKYDGDVLGNDFQESWQKVVEKAGTAIGQSDPSQIVHLSYGDVPARMYITELAADMMIHTWDVGQAIQCSEQFDDALVEQIYDYIDEHVDSYRSSGMFGPEIEIPDDAPLLHKLLGIAGRNPRVELA